MNGYNYKSLKIFEVDQPVVQSKKISKLPKELSDLDNVSYVNVDFANQSVSERLIDAGFDQTKSSIFTLEGVTQYITKEDFNSTMKEIATLSQNASSIFVLGKKSFRYSVPRYSSVCPF